MLTKNFVIRHNCILGWWGVLTHDVDFFQTLRVVDSQATIVDGDRAVLYVWYDNEFGYSCQVVRVMLEMAGITVPTLPAK